MLHLELLANLDQHQHFLQERTKKSDLFLVGGCVRDLLLGITDDPLDIDFTMGGTPETLYQEFDKQGLSHFMTEKFGTITFLPPDEPGREYQLTPLRTEGEYEDFRHPGEIHWSNDILLDFQRRDFTINAMYYFSLPKTSKAPLDFVQEGSLIDEHKLVKILQQEGYCFLTDLNFLTV